MTDAPTEPWAFALWRIEPEQTERDHPRGPEHELQDRPDWLDAIEPHPEDRGGWSAAGEIDGPGGSGA